MKAQYITKAHKFINLSIFKVENIFSIAEYCLHHHNDVERK
jgi:hypothetical protein